MTASVSAPVAAPVVAMPGDQFVEWASIGWNGYLAMLRLRGERGVPRMIYLDGNLLLMSPAYPHERLKERLGQFIIEVVAGLDIPCLPAGQTTFRRRSKRGGVEGDHTYYLTNEARMRGKTAIDLQVDPPPDLAVEAVHSHDARRSVEVDRRLGVPEVWVCDEAELVIRILGANGRYARSKTSAAFPFLTAEEIARWIHRSASGSETDWVKEVRRWVAETLRPRRETT